MFVHVANVGVTLYMHFVLSNFIFFWLPGPYLYAKTGEVLGG